MRQFNSFNNPSESGNKLLGLMLVIPFGLSPGLSIVPRNYEAKAIESYQPHNGEAEPSLFLWRQVIFSKSIGKNLHNQSGENPNKQTPANQNTSETKSSGTSLLKDLRELIRRDLLASGTNTESVLDETLDSLPIDRVNNPSFFFDRQSLKAGSLGSLVIPQNSIARTYSQYIEPVLTIELGFKIEKIKGGYGNANLYNVRNTDGVEFYMSLVPVGGSVRTSTETFIIFWEKDPRNI